MTAAAIARRPAATAAGAVFGDLATGAGCGCSGCCRRLRPRTTRGPTSRRSPTRGPRRGPVRARARRPVRMVAADRCRGDGRAARPGGRRAAALQPLEHGWRGPPRRAVPGPARRRLRRQPACQTDRMTARERLTDARLYLVCDARPRAFLDAALRGGADIVQLRDKTLHDAGLVAAARE